MKERPDYRRIHSLEFELRFRDDPPLKDVYTDKPGAVIYYDPKQGRPVWSKQARAWIVRPL